jgi:ferredoxin-NADP reductase
MERTALRRGLTWQTATVSALAPGTAAVVTITFDVADWPAHEAGQHLDIRLARSRRI